MSSNDLDDNLLFYALAYDLCVAKCSLREDAYENC
jgi:hypothetical protein